MYDIFPITFLAIQKIDGKCLFTKLLSTNIYKLIKLYTYIQMGSINFTTVDLVSKLKKFMQQKMLNDGLILN